MKKNLLVTLADKNYVKQAKQLFSSVYWNAGWRGDYMLFAHEIPEKDLGWFRKKGILVKKCKPLFHQEVGGMSPTLTSKFYLLTPEFKKWSNILYLDADIIVRASLGLLTDINGFAGIQDQWKKKLSEHIIDSNLIKGKKIDKKKFTSLIKEFKNNYNLNETVFCAGVMAFSTNVIKTNTFSRLIDLTKKYGAISRYGDQLTFNLQFYKKWKKLPPVFDVLMRPVPTIKSEKIKGVILHFAGVRHKKLLLWHKSNDFYGEWKSNLDRANSINLKEIQVPKKWTKKEIIIYSYYLKILGPYFTAMSHIDRMVGLFGIFLKKDHPKLYFKLKKLKQGVRLR